MTCPACGRAIPPDEVTYSVRGYCVLCRGMQGRAGRQVAWLAAWTIGTVLWTLGYQLLVALLRAPAATP